MAGWDLAVDIDTGSVTAAVRERDRTQPVALTTSLALGAYSATLRAVAAEAGRGRESASPARLVLAIPAAWTGRELSLLRAAALDVGLPDPEFAAQPIAAAGYLAPGTAPGQLVAVLGIRDGRIDTAVLRRTQQGFELAGPPGGIATDDGSGTSLEGGVLELLATVTAAGQRPEQLAAVCVTGQASLAGQAAPLITRTLGAQPQLAPSPELATVLGALATAHGRVPTGTSPEEQGSRYKPRNAAGRTLAARRRTWAYTVLATAAAIGIAMALILVLAHPGRTGGHRSASPSGSVLSVPPAGKNDLAYRLALHTLSMMPTTPVSYRVSAQFPVVTGLADAALQRHINDELLAPVNQDVSSFTELAKSVPAGSSGAFLGIQATVYEVKDILSVKYFAESHNFGAGDVSYNLNAVTIRMTTGTALGVSDIVTPMALTAPGRHRLAADLQAQKGISECDTLPGWTGGKAIVPVLAHISTPGFVVLNVTPGGLAFSFGDDTISPTVCRPVGVLPLAELSGLITPAVASLGSSAGASASASPAASSQVTSPATPATPTAVVQAYFAAINRRDYRRAWQLGGDHLGQSYPQFAAGFAGTTRDIVRIVSASGGTVAIKLTAVQSDGKRLVFTGTYTVTNGTIASSALVPAP